MQVLINYFSQTKMTETIAEKIAEAIKDLGHKCVLKPFDKVTGADIKKSDIIGCGTPVHSWHIPYNYKEFLKELPELQGKKAFVFVTYGEVITANVLYDMAEILKNKGAVVLGGMKSIGLHNMPPLRRKGKGAGHPNEQDIQNARYFADRIINKAEKSGQDATYSLYIRRPLVNFMSPFMTPKAMNKAMPKIKVDEKRCDQCGVCQKVCPVDNIDMLPYPVFKGDCLKCFQCSVSCPKEALRVNWLAMELFLPVLDMLKEKGESVIV